MKDNICEFLNSKCSYITIKEINFNNENNTNQNKNDIASQFNSNDKDATKNLLYNDNNEVEKDTVSVILSFKFFNYNSGNGTDLDLIQTLNFLNFDINGNNNEFNNKYLKIISSIANYDSESYKESKYVETPIISLLLRQESTTNMFYFFIKDVMSYEYFKKLQVMINNINNSVIKQFFEIIKFDLNNFILENMYSKEEYDNIDQIVRIIFIT